MLKFVMLNGGQLELATLAALGLEHDLAGGNLLMQDAVANT